MKLLKQAFFSIIILAILVQILAFIFPSHIIVSRAITIQAPADSIRPYVQTINGWSKWVAGMHDQNVHIKNANEAQIGNRWVTIQKVTADSVVSIWQNSRGKPLISTLQLIPAQNNTSTVVQWQYEQFLQWYPWQRFGAMVSDKIIGTMLEQNLTALQTLVEKQH